MNKIVKKVIALLLAIVIALITYIIQEIKKIIHHKKIQDYDPKNNRVNSDSFEEKITATDDEYEFISINKAENTEELLRHECK